MPKPAPFTPKPTIEKLPLAVRKDVRDNFESKKSDYESTIVGLLGFPVTINIDVNAVWAYGEALAATQAGGTFSGYVDGFIDALTKYVGTYGDLGKEYFKNAITKSEFTVTVNELGDRAETISADVKDGVFRIRFKHDCLGYNASWFDIHQIVEAIEGTPHEGFGLRAKHSIEDEYKANIEEVSEQIAKILNLPDLILDPNFEENYAALLKKTDQDWQRTFGSSTLEYFRDGVANQLQRQGFQGDDMLQEGFAEGVPSKTIKLRIVDKTKNGYANETVLEDGVVYIQTTADRWWTNVYEAGSDILGLL